MEAAIELRLLSFLHRPNPLFHQNPLPVAIDDEIDQLDDDEMPDELSSGLSSDDEGGVEQGQPREFSFRIGKDLTSRLDKYVVDRVGYLSRAEVQRMIAEQAVTVNGKKAKASYKPRENDQVVITARPPRGETIEPEDIPLDVIFEDEHLLAINKQADLIVHPARGRWHGTLVNGLIHYAKTWSTVRGPHRPGILHRLDRNTTGVMLIAKSDEAHWRMARQFETRTIQKTYMAIVHGVPELLAGLIDLPIGPDVYVKERMAVRKLTAAGTKTAQTMFEVLEPFPITAEAAGLKLERGDHVHDQNHKLPPPGFSLLRLKPKTGRTHQLRVHTSFRGWPIIGDTMYGGRVVEYHVGEGSARETRHLTRQALHAAEITFTHPRTLQKMTLEAPLPPDMTAIARELRSAINPGETPAGASDGVN